MTDHSILGSHLKSDWYEMFRPSLCRDTEVITWGDSSVSKSSGGEPESGFGKWSLVDESFPIIPIRHCI